MSKTVKKIIPSEIIAFVFILLLGALLIYDPSGTKNFNYPLAMRPEWQERFRIFGWGIVYGGYPLRVIIKLIIWLKRQ